MFDQMNADQLGLFDSLDTYLRRASSQRDGHVREMSRDHDWQQFARMGLLGLGSAPENSGEPEVLSIVANLLGYYGVRSCFQSTTVLANSMLSSVSDSAVRERLLGQVGSGKTTVALAHAESQNDYELDDVETLATSTPEGWRVSGRKIVVIDGDADLLIVSTRTSGDRKGPHGVSLFAIDAAASGVERRVYHAVDGSLCADISFNEVEVGSEMLVGQVDLGHDVLTRALDLNSVTMCAEAVGAMEAMFAQTIEYIRLREQFGVPLARFQVLRHRVVDMLVMLEQARSITWAAARALNSGDELRLIPAAKVKCIESGRMVGEASIQIHGGMGMTDELDIGHFYKRILAIEHSYGDRRFQLKKLLSLPRQA